MKHIVILLSIVNLMFASSANINFSNNLDNSRFDVLVNGEVVLKVGGKKVSKTIEVPLLFDMVLINNGTKMYEDKVRLEEKSQNTFTINERPSNTKLSLISVTSSTTEIYNPADDSSVELNLNQLAGFNSTKEQGRNNRVRGIRETNEVANVQIIHNSPYPIVDIYVDEAEALGDVPFRATTGMIQLPVSTTVGIAPANGDVIANFPFTLETNGNYVVSASGILGSDATPFGLVASGLELAAVDTNHFGLKVFHGVTDAPAVDIYANGNLLVDNLGYNEYKGYVQVPVGDYTIDVTAHGSDQSVDSFAAPLSGFGGGTGIVFASGFLASQSDSSFSLILATPSGYSVSLPATPTALSTIADNVVSPSVFRLKQNYPNPFNPSTSIDFEVFESSNVSLNVYDLSGRLVKNLLSENLNSGAYSIEWNGKNTNGISAAAGVYFYSISSGQSTLIKKMSLIK